ncbi:hypothetical protein [Comamonas aquatica]|uniref:hypothetical protein n=1 Tax=Comamonas aquatica TaxID=225991 RepID=UPI003CFF5362|nr:hypothetical protein [Comamonas sp.]
MPAKKPINENIHYLHGQIDGLAQLVLALASCTVDMDEFRDEGLKRLETLEGALLAEATPEDRLTGLAHIRTWFDAAT